jgi:hypothetical protein
MLLLFGTTLIMLYLNRSLIFEQKTSANQMRSTSAFEMAEAGIEWATGMLNNGTYIRASDCAPLPSSHVSFRQKYVQTSFYAATPSSNFLPATNALPGCQVAGTTLSCQCPDVPTSGTASASFAGSAPGFKVEFAAVPDPTGPAGATDTMSVQVTSTGCATFSGTCSDTVTTATDARAKVSVILKVRRNPFPPSPLTAGGNVTFSGSIDVTNTSPSTNGILINAGTSIDTGHAGNVLTTIPGQPWQNAIIPNDPSLSSLSGTGSDCSNSTMFQAYFGESIPQYRERAIEISCSSASDCGTKLSAAYASNSNHAYYFPDGLALNSSFTLPQLGSQSDAVSLVTPGSIDISGNIDIYGLVFSNNATYNSAGFGNANIHGAVVACRDYEANGSGLLTYDPKALDSLSKNTGVLARVPGSWRDF